MKRTALESAGANYPYLQGLWALPFGFMTVLTGVSNLQRGPAEPLILGILGGGLLLSLATCLLIARYYRRSYGQVVPTTRRRVRHAAAVAAWVVVLFVVGSRWLFWTPDSRFCVYAAAFALATLVYYAILVGLRAHHLVIWGSLFVAGLLPVWGGLGPDRDALAMFPLGIALMASGLLDQRLLARALGSFQGVDLESTHASG